MVIKVHGLRTSNGEWLMDVMIFSNPTPTSPTKKKILVFPSLGCYHALKNLKNYFTHFIQYNLSFLPYKDIGWEE